MRHVRQPSRPSAKLNRTNSTSRRTPVKARSRASIESDETTTLFVKRTLCRPQTNQSKISSTHDIDYNAPTPLEELLPPLTSSNDIDLQLYALIAVIISQFVQTWYSKITPDHDFIDEVIHIIAHCTRALEQRLRTTDLESLLLDEVPALLDAHLQGKRGLPWPHDFSNSQYTL